MSTPITFSGFNDIDFNVVLNGLMAQARQPLTLLETRQKALESQIKTFDTLNTKVSALRSAADRLSDMMSVSTMAGTSTAASAVAVSASSSATVAHYDVVVTDLARAQVTASTSTAPDATSTIVASGGSLTIGGVTVSIGGDATLQDLAAAINATDGIGVTASVINTGAGYRLVLTSSATGTANAFTVTNGLTGGAGVSFGDFDGNGVSGDSSQDNAIAATDAAILINNIAATSSRNTFDDVVPGVTLTVLQKDPAATIGIDIASDEAALQSRVEDFVSAYNDLVTFFDAQRQAASGGDESSIGRQPLLRQLRNSLRMELLGAHGSGVLTRLSEAGVEFTREGTIALDSARFAEAVASDGGAVRTLFAGTGGVFPAIEQILDGYSGSAGFISAVQDRLSTQMDAMDRQIEAMQARLAIERQSLQRQFTEADSMMSRLRNQSGSLASIGTGFGSF
jgi:flagellar hook-associated protein 2